MNSNEFEKPKTKTKATKMLCFLFLLLIVNETNQSHWRGGTISWTPVDKSVTFPINSTNVSIRQRYFDRLGYGGDDSCQTPGDIATGTNIVNKLTNNLISLNGPSWQMSAQVYCYDYNLTDNWQAGDRTQIQEITTSEPVNVKFQDGDWIDNIILTPDTQSANYFFELTIDLKQRSDTGKINSSPFVNLTTSLIRLSNNCAGINQTYVIPVSDPDAGDLVRCRCRNNSCHQNFTMDEARCVFYFNPTTTGLYGVYITIEDFAPSNINVPLSSIPLQLLVNVTNNPGDCCNVLF
jgi:hypothetical protein